MPSAAPPPRPPHSQRLPTKPTTNPPSTVPSPLNTPASTNTSPKFQSRGNTLALSTYSFSLRCSFHNTVSSDSPRSATTPPNTSSCNVVQVVCVHLLPASERRGLVMFVSASTYSCRRRSRWHRPFLLVVPGVEANDRIVSFPRWRAIVTVMGEKRAPSFNGYLQPIHHIFPPAHPRIDFPHCSARHRADRVQCSTCPEMLHPSAATGVGRCGNIRGCSSGARVGWRYTALGQLSYALQKLEHNTVVVLHRLPVAGAVSVAVPVVMWMMEEEARAPYP